MNSTVVYENEAAAKTLSGAKRGLLIGARFLTSLALSLWIGGMAFFGAMAAPVMFRMARASSAPQLAPQMVGGMLTRFGFVTTFCAALMLVCWVIDGALSRSNRQRLWQVQGVLSFVCLFFSVYLNSFLLPQTQAQQPEILPIFVRESHGQTLTADEIAKKGEFDKGHHAYQSLASINLYMLMAIMIILAARGVAEASPSRSEAL